MADKATGINPAMLRWARVQAGYATVAPVAARLKRAEAEIEAWESGAEFPTWRQLERLARDLYHRPTALFFLPAPPEEGTPTAEFRRLPESALEDLEPDTWLAVRQARARQLDLAELSPFADASDRQIVRELSPGVTPDGVDDLAGEARRYLGVAIEEQLGWASADDALDNWRDAVQSAGVWVFKRSFKQQDVAGFCLSDSRHPVVYLNNGQPKSRQIFTLFHELAHLLFDFNYLERFDVDHYRGLMDGYDRGVEIACNRFAGEFLVPSGHFQQIADVYIASWQNDDWLASLAERYRVSREVVLRKCLDHKLVDQRFYNEKTEEWKRLYGDSSKGGGGNYYATQGTYLGGKYTALAFRGYYRRAYDIDQLSDYLNVKASSVPGLEDWMNKRRAV